MMNLKTGSVYRIICLPNPDIQYVGSTFDQLRHRWSRHKSHYKAGINTASICKYFDEYGIENFRCVLIKEYLVCVDSQRDPRHLRVYEQLYINKLKCVNKQNAITFDFIKKIQAKQYYKQYREENKDNIKRYHEENKKRREQYDKRYREENKDKIKRYREENKDKMKQYREEKGKVKVVCAFCGSEVQKNGLTKHKKTKKCQSFQ